MSTPIVPLNGLGLVTRAQHLAACRNNRAALQQKVRDAQKALDSNDETARELECELGLQARYYNRELIIRVDSYGVALVPKPSPHQSGGWTHVVFNQLTDPHD